MDEQLIDELGKLGRLHEHIAQHSANAKNVEVAVETHQLPLPPEGLHACTRYPSNTNTSIALEAIDGKIVALVAAAAAALAALIGKIISMVSKANDGKLGEDVETAKETLSTLDPNKSLDDNKRVWELFQAKASNYVEVNALVSYTSKHAGEFESIIGNAFNFKIHAVLQQVEKFWSKFEDGKLDAPFLDGYYKAIDELTETCKRFKKNYDNDNSKAHIPAVLKTMKEVNIDVDKLKKFQASSEKTLSALRKDLQRIDSKPGRMSLKPKEVQAQLKAFREGIVAAQTAIQIQNKLLRGYVKVADIAKAIED